MPARAPKRPRVAADAWRVQRALRARPLVEATTRDEPINGGDAVDELLTIRAILDRALRGAPTK